MKLLILTHSLAYGGAERVASNMANYWSEKGWNVTLVTLAPETKDDYVIGSSVNRISLKLAKDSDNFIKGFRNNLVRIITIRRLLIQIKPNIALGMMSTANILLALAGLGLKDIALVGSERVHPPKSHLTKLWRYLRHHTYKYLDAIIVLAQESADWLGKNTKSKEVFVIPNIATWPIQKLQPYLDVPDQIQTKKILLLTGRLTDQKGFDVAISVFGRLTHNFPEWVLVIIGEGEKRAALEAQVKAANLTSSIFMPGRVGNIGDWYDIADIFVMTSHYEGFPNVLAEALAHGLPAVSFDCQTGPRDIIRHGIDGLLVSPGNETELERSLRGLMSDKKMRSNYSKNATDARDRFSTDRIMGLWEQVFLKLGSGTGK